MVKNKKLFLFVTLLAAGIWLYNVYLIKSAAGKSKNVTNSPVARVAGNDSLAPTAQYHFPGNIRDPFSPPPRKVALPAKQKKRQPPKIKAEIKPPPLTIDGILWDEKNPTAVLKNGTTKEVRIVKPGDVWDKITIVKIEKNCVQVKSGKKIFKIK